jgi:8-oxo-dGTP pyrophosphatase MutT (NUDIX family)
MHKEFDQLWILNDEVSKDLTIKNNSIKAAVVVIIYKNTFDQSVLYLIERNTYDGHHSGQMALPGGKMDHVDANLSETALREVHEEIGVVLESDQLFPLTPQWIHVSNHWVQPFYTIVYEKPIFTLNKREINCIFEIPISSFKDSNTLAFHELNILGNKVTSPKYWNDGKEIWGATAIILYQLFLRSNTKINLD